MQSNLQRLALGLALVLLGAPVAAQEPAPEAKAAFEAIKKELEQEFVDLRAATAKVSDEEAGRIRVDFFENVLPDFAERYAELGRAERGSKLGLDAWSQVIRLATMSSAPPERTRTLAGEALESLTRDHLQSESVANLASSLRYGAPILGDERVTTTLEAIAARSPHRTVKAAALYNLGALLGDERPEGDPRLVRSKAVLAELQRDFADVKYREGVTYADAARTFVFALENLAVGKPCPDFQAVDAEGVGFKLSDYAGKVVLVDFWGFW